MDDKTQITIEFDVNALGGYADSHLAMLWHLAQANPADGFTDKDPGDIVAKIGFEIIRRWLKGAPVDLYHHQQRHYYWNQLTKLGKWKNGVFIPDATVVNGQVVMPPDAKPEPARAHRSRTRPGITGQAVTR